MRKAVSEQSLYLSSSRFAGLEGACSFYSFENLLLASGRVLEEPWGHDSERLTVRCGEYLSVFPRL